MEIIKIMVTFVISAVLFAACNGEKKKITFYDGDSDYSADSLVFEDECTDAGRLSDKDVVVVPFKEKGGVKYVNVSVNGFGFEMIFDTGCSGTLISVAEANYLYSKGYLKPEDILGTSSSQIADGSIVENMVINLKEVVIDGKIWCPDVEATVSSNNNAPLLLGNEVLNRVASYSVDNDNKTINFKLRKK